MEHGGGVGRSFIQELLGGKKVQGPVEPEEKHEVWNV